MGGTAFDAKLGADYLQTQNIQSTAIGLTSSPSETAALYHHPQKLVDHFKKRVQPERFNYLVIYCNSLSFAGNWAELFPKKVWALKSTYQQIFSNLGQSKCLALTAEEKLKADLEDLAQGQSARLNLDVLDRLDWVQQLEELEPGKQIQAIQNYFHQFAQQGYQKVLLACTHFEREDLEKQTDIEVIQPGLQMLKQFVTFYQSGTDGLRP